MPLDLTRTGAGQHMREPLPTALRRREGQPEEKPDSPGPCIRSGPPSRRRRNGAAGPDPRRESASPFDRRVWQEATHAADAGYTVSIICPTGKGYEASTRRSTASTSTAIRCRRRPRAHSATCASIPRRSLARVASRLRGCSSSAASTSSTPAIRRTCSSSSAGFFKLLGQEVRLRPPRHQPRALRGEVRPARLLLWR